MLSLLTILIAVLGARIGWRRGMTRQIGPLLGIAFGAVGAHAFGDLLADEIFTSSEFLQQLETGVVIASFLGGMIVFFVLWVIFMLLGRLFRPAFDSYDRTILDSILGSVFTLGEYLLFLSVFFNLLGFVSSGGNEPPVPEKEVVIVMEDGNGETQPDDPVSDELVSEGIFREGGVSDGVEWGVSGYAASEKKQSARSGWPTIVKVAMDDDGNLAGVVACMAPDVFGSLGILELGHLLQLRDAKKIS